MPSPNLRFHLPHAPPQSLRPFGPRRIRNPLAAPRRFFQTRSDPAPRHKAWTSPSSAVVAAAAAVALLYTSSTLLDEADAEAPVPGPSEITIEVSKKKPGASKEQIRDLISSQHLQVKRSWENPGVYAWGSNTGRVAAPESSEPYIKIPQRIAYFDNVLLRDLKLDANFGAAIVENGDLVQWGKAYSEDVAQPEVTLKGQGLVSMAISADRIIALARSGAVYSIPVSKADQMHGPKLAQSSWIPFWSSTPTVSYRRLRPSNLHAGEKVTAVAGGLQHVLLLTNAGRVFSAASSSEDFPRRGELGVPGLNWHTRPAGPYDMCHELTTLKGFNIKKLACGDAHSLVLDREGRIFAFGDNSSGQLGVECDAESSYHDSPSLLPVNKLYRGRSQTFQVTDIFAGGQNSFFTVDATRVAGPSEGSTDVPTLGRITADTWACGQGIKGSLGNGKWTHIQDAPTKLPSFSGLFEYDEVKRAVIPIRLAHVSVGSTHAAAVMDNVTYLDANERSSENDTNWGADVLWWGGNEFYQLGTGKRNNVATPQYLRPLDMAAEVDAGRREEHRFHLTPKQTVKFKGREVDLEQRIECGRNVTAVYSAV